MEVYTTLNIFQLVWISTYIIVAYYYYWLDLEQLKLSKIEKYGNVQAGEKEFQQTVRHYSTPLLHEQTYFCGNA